MTDPKIIGVWIAKGGSGKSSTAGNLVYSLRNHGKVLLIDADPSGNASSWIHPGQFTHELSDVLNGASVGSAIVKIRDNLDMIPTFAIGGSLKVYAETILPSKPFAFASLADDIAALGYDYIVYDMSPGTSTLERNIIASLDEVLPIARPEYFSADGLEIFAATLKGINTDMRAKATAPRLVVNGINMSFAVHRDYYAAMKLLPYQVYSIPQTIKITDAQASHLFLAEYDAGNRAIPLYDELARDIA